MTDPEAPVPKRRGRPPKPRPEAVRTNPDCSNPACVVTCSPNCENLIDMQDYQAWRRAEREHEMGSDPTLRSKDVLG